MTDATTVLGNLISEFESSLSSRASKPNILLPTAAQFYRLGLVLADLSDSSIESQPLVQCYQGLLEVIPLSHLRGVLEDLQEAFVSTLQAFEADEGTRHDVELALQSLYGLYSASPATLLLAAAGHPVAGWSLAKFQLLSSVHAKLIHDDDDDKGNQNPDNHERDRSTASQGHLLSLVAIFLGEPTVDYEELLPAIHQLQDKPYKHLPSAWEDLVQWQRSRDPQWKNTLVSRFTEPTQQQYILAMFTLDDDDGEDESPKQTAARTATTTRPSSQSSNNATKSAKTTAKTNAASEIQRRVEQVRAILPHLGDGFIEVALSHFQGDVEQTTGALVESQLDPSSLPVALELMDKQLPGRWKGATTRQQQKEEEEARKITRQAVRAMEALQEAEARALEIMGIAPDVDEQRLASTKATARDEYNDDYDDQYDDLDGFMTADHGLYDDYDTVRTYNKLVKQVGEDHAFWAENRNLNRSLNVQGNKTLESNDDGDDGDEDNGETRGRKFRGPDKAKGGRIPKPITNGEPPDSNSPQTAGIMRGGGGRGGSGRGGRGRGGRGGRGGPRQGRARGRGRSREQS